MTIMNTKPTTWSGSRLLVQQPELRVTETADSTTTTVSYSGPWNLCVSSKPARGQSFSGFPGIVASTDLVRKPGGVGVLTITITAQNEETEIVPGITETKWELKWLEVRKPLASHPRYTAKNAGYGTPAFGNAKSDDVWTETVDGQACSDIKVSAVMAEVEKSTLDEAKARIAKGSDSDQRALVTDYLNKLGRSTEGYKAFTPTITKTTTSTSRPSATGAGFISGSAPSGCPLLGSIPDHASYTWFKDADDVTATGKSGSYERTELWIGADDVDADLYKKAGA